MHYHATFFTHARNILCSLSKHVLIICCVILTLTAHTTHPCQTNIFLPSYELMAWCATACINSRIDAITPTPKNMQREFWDELEKSTAIDTQYPYCCPDAVTDWALEVLNRSINQQPHECSSMARSCQKHYFSRRKVDLAYYISLPEQYNQHHLGTSSRRELLQKLYSAVAGYTCCFNICGLEGKIKYGTNVAYTTWNAIIEGLAQKFARLDKLLDYKLQLHKAASHKLLAGNVNPNMKARLHLYISELQSACSQTELHQAHLRFLGYAPTHLSFL